MTRLPLPLCTLAICAAAAAAFAMPQLAAVLVYDRRAIGEGEIWRLASGNLVHFSAEHFLKDVLALLAAGALLELRRDRLFPLLCTVSTVSIGVLLYATHPQLVVYGGLSGVVIAAVAYLCLQGASEPGPYGWLFRAALLGLAAKIDIDFALSAQVAPGFALVPASHATGALAAVLIFSLRGRIITTLAPNQ